MSIVVYSIDDDHVITAKFISGKTNYEFGIDKLVPLISKLDIQRNLQDTKFYRRLERDILKGCIMPPITLAFVTEPSSLEGVNLSDYVNENIDKAFILDGIQRLNTLSRANQGNKDIDLSRPLFLNIIICYSMDNLLYRMITLNNGQKPMTPRHQIEMLAANVYDFDSLSIKVHAEKGSKRAVNGAFKKADIIKAYIAFLSNSINIDNQKIIESKMEELIADKILDSNITDDNLEFEDVIGLVAKFSEDLTSLAWFQVNNNLIGFSVGVKKSFGFLSEVSPEEFSKSISVFEKAFSYFNVSKFNIGQQRRKLTEHFISRYENLAKLDENELIQLLSELD
ncbi:MAG: hypothetical protein J0M11_18430 [Anaerolineae bacterium]|nr:hypothetical protein [Anaerolineae bacterium]